MKNKGNKMDVIIIMSSDLAGGVRKFSAFIRRDGFKSLLITNVKDDPNAAFCDFSIYFPWKEDLNPLIGELNLSFNIAYIINACERLIHWQLKLIEGLNRNDPNLPAYYFLKSKYDIRKKLHTEGIEDIQFIGGTLRDLLNTQCHYFPCVIKPSYYSGASRWVRTCIDDAELKKTIVKFLNNPLLIHEEFIVEEYLPGIEFSYDGYVENQKFNGLFLAEKLNFDYQNNHDGDSIISPPVTISKQSVCALEKKIRKIVKILHIHRMFLHIEGRVNEDNVNIIEINARMGGGEYSSAIKYITGIDPIKTMFELVGKDEVSQPEEHSPKQYTMMVKFNIKQRGVFKSLTSLTEILALPNVINGYISDGFEISSLERENVMAAFTICGDSYEEVIDLREHIKKNFRFLVSEKHTINTKSRS